MPPTLVTKDSKAAATWPSSRMSGSSHLSAAARSHNCTTLTSKHSHVPAAIHTVAFGLKAAGNTVPVQVVTCRMVPAGGGLYCALASVLLVTFLLPVLVKVAGSCIQSHNMLPT